jgi:hypothetical protein
VLRAALLRGRWCSLLTVPSSASLAATTSAASPFAATTAITSISISIAGEGQNSWRAPAARSQARRFSQWPACIAAERSTPTCQVLVSGGVGARINSCLQGRRGPAAGRACWPAGMGAAAAVVACSACAAAIGRGAPTWQGLSQRCRSPTPPYSRISPAGKRGFAYRRP